MRPERGIVIPPAAPVVASQGRHCLHLIEEMYKMGNSGNKKAMEKVEELREEEERSGQGHGKDWAENIKGKRKIMRVERWACQEVSFLSLHSFWEGFHAVSLGVPVQNVSGLAKSVFTRMLGKVYHVE